MPTLPRRAALLAPLALAAGRPAVAQTRAANVVRMVIPWAPGGSTDVVGRHFANSWSVHLGQTVVVENRGGASGTIGHAYVANAAPDGRTVLLGTNSTFAIAPSLYKNIPYQHEQVFASVTLLAQSPLVLCVKAGLPATDVRSLIALAKARPGALNLGIGGTGATGHLAGEMFMALSGTEMTLVAYRGSGQTVQGLATGEIDVAFLSATTIKPLAEAGMARVLGTTGSGRSVTLPDVPPIGDTGVPQFEATTTYGLFVPRATPEAEILRLHEAALQSLAEPLLREKLATEDFEVIGGGPAALDAHVRSETAKWAEIIRVRNITVSN